MYIGMYVCMYVKEASLGLVYKNNRAGVSTLSYSYLAASSRARARFACAYWRHACKTGVPDIYRYKYVL
jgi:hypothetical protein